LKASKEAPASVKGICGWKQWSKFRRLCLRSPTDAVGRRSPMTRGSSPPRARHINIFAYMHAYTRIYKNAYIHTYFLTHHTQKYIYSADVAAGHHFGSAADMGFTSQSTCVQAATDQHRYKCARYGASRVAVPFGMTLQWTPPLEAAGAVYKVCSVVQDDAPSASTRCWTISVVRCMYCTDTESLSHLATRCSCLCIHACGLIQETDALGFNVLFSGMRWHELHRYIGLANGRCISCGSGWCFQICTAIVRWILVAV